AVTALGTQRIQLGESAVGILEAVAVGIVGAACFHRASLVVVLDADRAHATLVGDPSKLGLEAWVLVVVLAAAAVRMHHGDQQQILIVLIARGAVGGIGEAGQQA